MNGFYSRLGADERRVGKLETRSKKIFKLKHGETKNWEIQKRRHEKMARNLTHT